jgi:hypothetical protein
MPQLTVIVDVTTEHIIREFAKKERVSLSHFLNNLIQRGLVTEDNADSIASFLKKPKLRMVFKKLLTYSLENLALTQYQVKNLGDDTTMDTNEQMLEIARDNAIRYVEGLFEEFS